MLFKHEKILDILKDKNIYYEIIKESKNTKAYSLASIKGIVENGIYFLTKEYIFNSELIKNSVIFTNVKKVNTKDNNTYIYVEKPQLTHYIIANSIEETKKVSSIHPSAIIDEKAKIAKDAYIGPFCIVGNCTIESNVKLLNNITINDNVVIKKNTIIEGHSVIGARGMAWIWDSNGDRIMQPQLGGVVIEEDCILGTDITVVRGSLSENTTIGRGTIIAHGSKIGHGCQIDKFVHMANNVSLAGNAFISQRVFLGSGSVVSSNVSIAEGCVIGAGAVVHKPVLEKNCTLAGVPARIIKNDNFANKPKGAPKPFKIDKDGK